MNLSWIGWVATVVFCWSYFFKHPVALRRMQGVAAILWVIYGVAIHAWPVIVANVLVSAMALFSSGRRRFVVTK